MSLFLAACNGNDKGTVKRKDEKDAGKTEETDDGKSEDEGLK